MVILMDNYGLASALLIRFVPSGITDSWPTRQTAGLHQSSKMVHLRMINIGNLDPPNHGGELCFCMKSLDMILNRKEIASAPTASISHLFALALPSKILQRSLVFCRRNQHIWLHVTRQWKPSTSPQGYIRFSPKVSCFTVREIAEVRVGCCCRGSAGWGSMCNMDLSLFSTTVIEDSCFSLEGELKARTRSR